MNNVIKKYKEFLKKEGCKITENTNIEDEMLKGHNRKNSYKIMRNGLKRKWIERLFYKENKLNWKEVIEWIDQLS